MLYTQDPKSTHHGAIKVDEARAREAADSARAKMEADIERGRASATALIERVFTEVPQDFVLPAKGIEFGADETGIFAIAGENEWNVHPWALDQVADRVSTRDDAKGGNRKVAPAIKAMADFGGWERDIACRIINEVFARNTGKYLVRAVDSKMRAFLSNRYRRLNTRDTLGAFVAEAADLGAVPIDGVGTDTRVALRMALPEVFEPVSNEPITFYVEFRDSEFGNGATSISLGVNRLWCLNKATMFDEMETVHLGKRLSENFEFSQKTYELDTATVVSAVRDLVPQSIGEKAIEQRCELIKRADARQLKWSDVKEKLARKLLKGELEEVKNLFESEDVGIQSLPEKPSAWRLSNVLSLLANRAEDNEKRLELQSYAGEVLKEMVPA